MASNLQNQTMIPFAGKWKSLTVTNDGQSFVPEPKGSEEDREIWESQVMILFSIYGTVYAFGGPIPDKATLTKEVMDIFPCYTTCEPRIFDSDPYNFGFLKNANKLFRSAPYGLRPLGETYDPTNASNNIPFNYTKNTFSKYIDKNQSKKGEEVWDVEHIAFLTLWLSHYVFYSKSLQIAKMLIPMATQIHEGRQFRLGKLILASLYDSIGEACDDLKRSKDRSPFLVAGPKWLLQLRLSAIFEKEMGLTFGEDYLAEIANRSIEGTRLVRLSPHPIKQDLEQLFMKYMKIFLKFDKLTAKHTPLIERKFGPSWFTEDFPASNPDAADDVNEVWDTYLDPTVLSCRVGTQLKHLGLVGYQPNLVSRQFGFAQILSKSLYESSINICLGCLGISENWYKKFLKITSEVKYNLQPFKYTNSHFCTKEFSDWWGKYYSSRSMGDDALLAMMENGFNQPQIEKIRSKIKNRVKSTASMQNVEKASDAAGPSKKQNQSKLKEGRNRAGSSSTETAPKKAKPSNTITFDDDKMEEHEVPLIRKKLPTQTETQGANAEENQAGDSQPTQKVAKENKKDKKEKSSSKTTETNTDEGLVPKKDKKKKKKSKSSDDKAAGTNSTQPSIEIEMKESEDIQPDARMNEHQQEILEQQNQDVSNAESPPPKEMSIPEIIPEVETVVEKVKEAEVDMSDPKDQELPNKDQPTSSSPKDKKSSSTDGINWEDMVSDSDIPTRSGGSSIPAVSSSTSKLSADIGVSPKVFKKMHETKPDEALAILIKAREDAFERLKADPKAFYSMKAFLAELQTPLTNESMFSLVTQIEAHLDQFAKDLQKLLNNEEQVKAQRLAQAILWEKANISCAKVKQMKKQSNDTTPGVNTCKENIAQWTLEIQDLQIKMLSWSVRLLKRMPKNNTWNQKLQRSARMKSIKKHAMASSTIVAPKSLIGLSFNSMRRVKYLLER
ncbi:hypothetical protein A2U01_0000390 [Trifolium medium]|uniref:Aminotransferase-like plant mobile domain-containing protein n=1 Tax=Trifolium medium TaxID=97028 RepID=A0A392LXE8_9FABA|nr:hypothetical protein [Trifolium medium]